MTKILASSDLRNELSPKSDIYVMLASDFSAIIILKWWEMELTLEEKYGLLGWKKFGGVAVLTFIAHITGPLHCINMQTPLKAKKIFNYL